MAESIPKIKILQGAAPDLSAATYQIHDESHTIGNALRWMLMKNRILWLQVKIPSFKSFVPVSAVSSPTFLSFLPPKAVDSPCRLIIKMMSDHPFPSVPHPSENVINVRIQMYDDLSSLDALVEALGNLDNLCESIEDTYLEDLRKNNHETWREES
ncbi:hypothetical protein D9756_006465 [Leucocoprinus leucothites]|uniref:DNA-directed RNA polymerase RBP11-like dimerisation domain-containing protein n=1 Tax=Leucocoprinus leucothites TaxID=201217 RepID=A0A8H5G1Y9_9AGAR|nr:hypothetical protein D9756_006465 [Leucoagaricus leucothites]